MSKKTETENIAENIAVLTPLEINPETPDAELSELPDGTWQDLELSDIDPHPENARALTTPASVKQIAALAESIVSVGLKHRPIVLHTKKGAYWPLSGNRRHAALLVLQSRGDWGDTVRARVIEEADISQAQIDSVLTDQGHTEGLTPLGIWATIARDARVLSVKQIAHSLKLSEGYVRRRYNTLAWPAYARNGYVRTIDGSSPRKLAQDSWDALISAFKKPASKSKKAEAQRIIVSNAKIALSAAPEDKRAQRLLEKEQEALDRALWPEAAKAFEVWASGGKEPSIKAPSKANCVSAQQACANDPIADAVFDYVAGEIDYATLIDIIQAVNSAQAERIRDLEIKIAALKGA